MERLFKAFDRLEELGKALTEHKDRMVKPTTRHRIPVEGFPGFESMAAAAPHLTAFYRRVARDGSIECIEQSSPRRPYPISHDYHAFTIAITLDTHPFANHVELHAPGLFGVSLSEKRAPMISVVNDGPVVNRIFDLSDHAVVHPDLESIRSSLEQAGYKVVKGTGNYGHESASIIHFRGKPVGFISFDGHFDRQKHPLILSNFSISARPQHVRRIVSALFSVKGALKRLPGSR